MRAWVHTHLPRLRSGETLSVLSVKVPGHRVDYAARVELRDVEFKVHEHGRQRCIADGVRNVHAWVIGDEEERDYFTAPEPRPAGWRQAVYDPWKGGTFVDSETLAPVHRALYAILSGKNVYYLPSKD